MTHVGFRAPTAPAVRAAMAAELAAIGFDWMEIGYDFAPDGDRQIRELARQLGLALSFHCHFVDVNLSSLVPQVREAAIALVKADLERAADLGARVAVVHGGDIGWFDFIPPDHPDYAENQAVIDRLFPLHRRALTESLSLLAERAHALGVKLVAENMYMPWEVLKEPSEVDLLPAGVDLCLDFGHARVAGLVPQAFPASRIGHTHIHWNDGQYDLHKPLVPEVAEAYRPALSDIVQARPDTCLMLELPPRSALEYRAGMEALKQITTPAV